MSNFQMSVCHLLNVQSSNFHIVKPQKTNKRKHVLKFQHEIQNSNSPKQMLCTQNPKQTHFRLSDLQNYVLKM